MKRGLSYAIGISAVVCFLLFNSCNKVGFPLNHYPNPLTGNAGGCQVADYHLSEFDPLPQGAYYLFHKKYDASGKNVKEIIFNISEDVFFGDIFRFQADYQVVDKGRKVYLITSDGLGHGLPDTTATIYINASGRPDSIVSYSQLTYHFDKRAGETVKTYFSYKDQRLFSARNVFHGYFVQTDQTDTVHYDSHGNMSSFADYTYQYDYTRTAKQQCYLDDYMQNKGELYLCEYLGYFPEITSPTNVRTAISGGYESGALTNHTFDGEGKLIGYDSRNFGHVTITWNCSK